MTPHARKAHARAEMLALVRAQPPDRRALLSGLIARNLAGLPAIATAKPPAVVLLFAALRTEPDLTALPALLPGVRFALPRVCPPTELHPHAVDDFTNLVASPLGVREPDPLRHPRVTGADLAAIIVPGLAFATTTGLRLGRGGGYYDRFLAKPETARATRIGVCFDLQAVADLPAEPHDARVDWIVTDARVLHTGR